MATETLRPNADGDSSECTGSDGNQVNNYELIDESSTDDADYVYATGTTDGTWRIDLYNLPSTAIAVGSTINKITFYERFKTERMIASLPIQAAERLIGVMLRMLQLLLKNILGSKRLTKKHRLPLQ